MNTIRTEYLTRVIRTHFEHTSQGHCARVDYLTRDESLSACTYMQQHQDDLPFQARLLVSTEDTDYPHLSLTTDQAVEQRNLKQQSLCLFVPTDMVDAAVSSLGNSFAPIDGRELLKQVREQIDKRLSASTSQLVRSVFSRLRGVMKIGEEQKLDFVCAMYDLEQAGQLERAGLELWRVGLIVDAGERFDTRLDENRRCVRELRHPDKIHATTSERIQKLLVDSDTTNKLMGFFRGQALYNVHSWSRALADGDGPTFDQWQFPDAIPSDIRLVTIKPFLDKKGAVRKTSRLSQPNGSGTSLIAHYGDQGAVAVQWDTDPKTPQNLHRWRVSLIPSEEDTDTDSDIELPTREIAGHRRNLTIKLDMELEDPPDFGVRVQVVPLDSSGNQIVSTETGERLQDESEEFVLRPEDGGDIAIPKRDSRHTVPSLAYGRIAAIVEKDVRQLQETEPLLSNDLDYFSLKLSNQHTVIIGLSSVLVELERRTLHEPLQGGRFSLSQKEVSQATASDFSPLLIERRETDAWGAFWRERERLFKQIQQPGGASRDLVETTEWSDSLLKTARSYARSYHKLLDSLCSDDTPADRDALMDALSLDTSLIRLQFGPDSVEESFVLLPTHPLRIVWFATYTRLLRQWEEELIAQKKAKRKHLLDLDVLQMLAPVNIPAFFYHPEAREPGVFFQNLHWYHGVAFAAQTPDPQRRLSDLATILGVRTGDTTSFRLQPERLATHIKRFISLHPYVQTLMVNLINPDRGDLLADALQLVLKTDAEPPDDMEPTTTPPKVHITSYVIDTRKSRGESLEQLRLLATNRLNTDTTDYLLPNLSTTVRQLNNQHPMPLKDAHITIGTDLTHPHIVAVPFEETPMSSFALQGLLCRFVLSFSNSADGLRWRYQIIPDVPSKDDYLIGTHAAMLRAGGHLLHPEDGVRVPALEVAMDTTHRQLLEHMHEQATWVITLDRFFVLDYYDSPHDPSLQQVARKYLLDYAPEFVEGLGHRLMVTTTWQDEIGAILERAMYELGFVVVDRSVRDLLHYLKVISGRLVLQAFESTSSATAAVGLGVVTAWLQQQGRLADAILVPVDAHPGLLMPHPGKATAGTRRCDLVLFKLKRAIVEATFIEVKWRRGRAPVEELSQDMLLQMEGTAQVLQERFFDMERLDGALQRTYLANVLRFYLERALRYQLVESATAQSFLEHLSRLEKIRLDFRPSYEGFIVSLDSQPRPPFVVGDARMTLLTAEDFAQSTQFQTRFTLQNDGTTGEQANQDRTDIATIPEAESRDICSSPPEQNSPSQTTETVSQPDDPSEASTTVPAEVAVPLGKSPGGEIAWHPSVKGSPHLFILGIPGQGKSWAVTRMLAELGQQHVPSLVLDFHGQFADPDGPFVQNVAPAVIDAAKGLPFSPFECTTEEGPDGWVANSFGLAEIFGYVAGLGDMQRDLVFTAIRDAYRTRGFGEDAQNAIELPTLNEVLTLIETRERNSRTSNVTARCRPLLEMDLFRPEGQEFSSLVQQGVVIDLHNLYVETLQMAAGAFVLRKIYKDMFRWGPSERLRLAIVLDEAHRLARDVTLPKIMKEGRKFGIAVIVASQGLSDFHPDIVSNAGTKIIFRINYPESRKIAGFIRARQGQDLASRLEQLSVGTAYVQTPDMSFGSVVEMYPLE